MTVDEIVARARAACSLQVTYLLGAGGMKPLALTPADGAGRCDCSGFVCWCLGICRQAEDREFVQANGGWINTDAMVADIHGAHVLLRPSASRVGAVVVFPGPPRRSVGHCGIVVSLNPIRIVHCSASNWRSTGKAIRETNDALFRTADTVYGWPVASTFLSMPARPAASAPVPTPTRTENTFATVGSLPALDATLVHEQLTDLWPTRPTTRWERLLSKLWWRS